MGLNATMINEQADRPENGQRALTKQRFGNTELGTSRNLGSIFSSTGPMESPDAAAASLLETKEVFMHTVVAYPSNPDFEEDVSMLYEGTANMLSNATSADDKPNRKYPNLSVPKINVDGSLNTQGMVKRSLQEGVAGGVTEDGSVFGKGFGTKTHAEGVYFRGRYLKNRDSEETTIRLGEYFNKDEYDWEA
jgi:hypothetical protein